MKNLKIRTKFLVTFTIVIAMFFATGGMAIVGLRENADKYSNFYNVGYKVTYRVMAMRRSLQSIVKNLAYITITDDEAKFESYSNEMNKETAEMQESFKWMKENFKENDELLNSFEEQMIQGVELQNTILSIHKDHQKAQDLLLNDFQPLVDTAIDDLIQITNISEQQAEEDYQNTLKLQKTLETTQITLAFSALFFTIIICIYLTKSITKPIRQLEKSAGQIVEGNFAIAVTYESKDEMGNLAHSFRNMTQMLEIIITDISTLLSEMADGNFNIRTKAEERYVGNFHDLLLSIRKMNRNLSSTLSQINQSADQVSSGSGQVSNGAQALAQGATEQASAVEQLASTITNISHQVKSTADNAMEAKSQSIAAGDEVQLCNNQMIDMMSAMEEITRSSNEISKIIKTIEDIAFQTNILALNAAVEAARAGEAGKGFAVVAEEVRSLASKSSIASKNTAELIESSVNAVTRGTQIANSTAQSLVKVVDQVRSASSKVDDIAVAAENQSDAIEQVTIGVDQISSVVQTNSATAEESAAASQELSEQAATLKNLVAKFKLREDYTPANTETNSGYPTIHL